MGHKSSKTTDAVSCPGLPGCFSQGDIVEEALENIKGAIQACLESLAEDELKTYLTNPSSRVVDVLWCKFHSNKQYR